MNQSFHQVTKFSNRNTIKCLQFQRSPILDCRKNILNHAGDSNLSPLCKQRSLLLDSRKRGFQNIYGNIRWDLRVQAIWTSTLEMPCRVHDTALASGAQSQVITLRSKFSFIFHENSLNRASLFGIELSPVKILCFKGGLETDKKQTYVWTNKQT
jgi:hypothetical protein